MAPQAKTLPTKAAYHWAPDQVLAVTFPIQFPANVLKKFVKDVATAHI